MYRPLDKIEIKIKLDNAEEQAAVQRILQELEKTNEFSSICPTIKVQKSRFTPEEVVLLIIIGFASQLSSDLTIAFLRNLWDRLKEKNMTPEIEDLDQVKNKAEKYIRGLGVTRFHIIKVEDHGLYAEFEIKDSKGIRHILLIAKTDLSILKYHRSEGN